MSQCLFWVCAYSEEKCTHFQSDYGVLTSPQVRSDGQPGEESCFYSDWYFQLWDITQTGVCLIEPDLLTTGGASKLRIISKMIEGNGKPKLPLIHYSETSWFCAAGMAGSCRHQSGAAPVPEGAGADKLLSEDRAQSWGGRWVHAGGSPSPSGVFPVWRRSSGRPGETEAGLLVLPALWTRLQRGGDCLLLQVRVP